MKKPLLVLAFAAMYVGACAQSSVAYFVEGSTFRTQLNPAFAPHKGYLNIPVLGGVQVDINGNIPFGALLFDNDGKLSAFTEKGVSIDEVLSKVSARNDLSVGSRINIFGIGSYTRNARNFWSVDLAMNLAGEVNAPRELFTFLKAGQATDIRDVHVAMQSYADLSFAYSLRLCPGLYFGARIRAIAGMLGASADIERLDISIGSDRWYADMAGSIEMNGIDGDLQTGDRISLDEVTDYIDVASMLKPSGYGGAIDLGITYDPTHWLQLSASVTDLGFVKYGGKNSRRLVFEKHIDSDMIDIENGVILNPEDIDLNNIGLTVEQGEAATRRLTTAVNIGADFEFLDRMLGLGLLYNAKIYGNKSYHTLIGSVNAHPLDWLGVTVAYSMIDNKASALSFALNLCPGWINFYLSTDVLTSKHIRYMIPRNGTRANVTFGIGIPIGRWGARGSAMNILHRWIR